MGQTKQVDETIDIDTENLIPENLSVVVFIQSSSSKTVYLVIDSTAPICFLSENSFLHRDYGYNGNDDIFIIVCSIRC